MQKESQDNSHQPDLCVAFGSLRSGTSMLRLMLDGHPRIVCPDESDFLVDFLHQDSDGRLRYDLAALAANRIFQDSPASLPDTDEALPAFTSMVNDLRGDTSSCLVLVLHRGLDRLLELVPSIPVLHLNRDPRDVARSAIGMGWAGNVYYGARTWLTTEREWERVAPMLRSDQGLEFQYEALVRDPEGVLGSICAFLGDRYEASMLDYPSDSTYGRPDPSLVEQWRKKQSPRELGLIEPLFGDLLIKRGYEPSGHPPISPGLFERLKLRMEHSRSFWSRRIERYGFWDPLVVSACNRLGLTGLSAPARRRMAEITRQHLK